MRVHSPPLEPLEEGRRRRPKNAGEAHRNAADGHLSWAVSQKASYDSQPNPKAGNTIPARQDGVKAKPFRSLPSLDSVLHAGILYPAMGLSWLSYWLQTNYRGGRSQTMFSSLYSETFRVSDHPVRAISERELFLDGASTPPREEGNEPLTHICERNRRCHRPPPVR